MYSRPNHKVFFKFTFFPIVSARGLHRNRGNIVDQHVDRHDG